MVIIISKKRDKSTEDVMEWIDAQGGLALRINGDDVYGNGVLNICIDNEKEDQISFRGKALDIPADQAHIGWFRRWSDQEYMNNILSLNVHNAVFGMMERVMRNDEGDIRAYLFSKLGLNNWLLDGRRAYANKMIILSEAVRLGMIVPATQICTTKADLRSFKERHNRIITKDISVPYDFYSGKARYSSFTTEITDDHIDTLPDTFFPSLFQELLEKEYELRIFYLDGQCYPMAIFSQNDSSTSVDFRRYNQSHPNRNVPYILPEEIEKQIYTFMNALEMKTGSIDMVRTTNGRYVFLEVNPGGQFGMVSYPCNYHLEKKVAKYLLDNQRINKVNNGRQ
jgi:ATP-GRASP peptide maturase of grasp-with-spasm system